MITIIKIGRDDSNDISINEPRVSRNHAVITKLDDESFEVKDLGSTNGSFVNGQRISQQIIKEGDKLEIAGCIVNWFEAFSNTRATEQGGVIQEKPFAKIRKTISVGSSIENDIVLSDNFVSAHHAKISLLKNGSYYIEDMGSSNSTFVNGHKIMKKNFAKTDIVRIANADLPDNWFQQKSLQRHFFKENKKRLLISLCLLIIASGSCLCYYNRCGWFQYDCILSPQEIYMANKNCIVHIVHSYYYSIETNGITYYVGKNKVFKGTEANTSMDDLFPYNSVSGIGCFIDREGNILTSFFVANPWLNESEQKKMFAEVKESRTIPKLNFNVDKIICGRTVALSFLPNGQVNNPQNYIAVTADIECGLNNNGPFTIQSVKKSLPPDATVVNYSYDTASKDAMHKTRSYYYSVYQHLKENAVFKDSFYMAKDNININKLNTAPINNSLQVLPEGSAILNDRGELVGIAQQQQHIFLHRFFTQLKK